MNELAAQRVPRVHVIQHLAFEDPGVFAAELATRHWPVQLFHAGVDDLAPCREADLLIVMGGPIGVYEQDRYPVLTEELRVLEHRLAADMPTLGICLGTQLLAQAAGGSVHPGNGKEIGWGELDITPAGRESVLQHLQGQPVLHWHGDTFELPPQTTLLASTARYRHQAFSVTSQSLGLQFHPEVDHRRFEQWLIGHACELGQAVMDPRELRRTMPAATASEAGMAMFGDWLDSLRFTQAADAPSRSP